jgi:hypothetical protein
MIVEEAGLYLKMTPATVCYQLEEGKLKKIKISTADNP